MENENRVIAKFMGLSNMITPEEFEYHESYDWLMPVWVKFRDLELNGLSTKEAKDFIQYKIGLSEAIPFVDIKHFHEMMFNAVSWYNSIIKNDKG